MKVRVIVLFVIGLVLPATAAAQSPPLEEKIVELIKAIEAKNEASQQRLGSLADRMERIEKRLQDRDSLPSRVPAPPAYQPQRGTDDQKETGTPERLSPLTSKEREALRSADAKMKREGPEALITAEEQDAVVRLMLLCGQAQRDRNANRK